MLHLIADILELSLIRLDHGQGLGFDPSQFYGMKTADGH
jgi:hypothetical protein